jgi:Ca-activated chloride channel homolog
MKIIANLLCCLLLMLAPFVSQGQTAAPEVIQRGNKVLVNIPVVVSDRSGRRISNLKKEDFSVYHNGTQQTITSFIAEDEPANIALLLDTSGSTQAVLNRIKNAAKDFIDSLNPRDKCMIATFDTKLNILISFSSDRNDLKRSLDKIQTSEDEGSVVYSSLNQIAQHSFSRVQGRKAIVLLSDGKDFGSDVSRAELLNELEESDVSIYSIYYQSGLGFNKPVIDTTTGTVTEGKTTKAAQKQRKPKKRKRVYTVTIPLPADTMGIEEIKLIDKTATTGALNALRELSDLTAGRLYLSDDEKLSSIFRQVAAELKQQYVLGVYVDGVAADTVMRDLSVQVNRQNVVVQTRKRLQ